MPDSEKDQRRREQQGKHITKGRERERHFSSGSAGRILARLADDGASPARLLLLLLLGVLNTLDFRVYRHLLSLHRVQLLHGVELSKLEKVEEYFSDS